MTEPSWKNAIMLVLGESKAPMHPQEITERILSRGIKSTSGATPVATVHAQISASIKHDGLNSPFQRVGKGVFALRQSLQSAVASAAANEDGDTSDTVIQAFGMYWQRDLIVWRRTPKLYGRQQVGAKSVDFGGQRGIYVLYDHHTVVYVGRSVERPLGQRLYEHTLDRLSGRWNRVSWFGLYGVADSGKLVETEPAVSFGSIVTALEAVLIETLEPPQNRKRGDDFTAVEFIQDIDPELRERELQSTLRNIEQKFRHGP